MEAQYTSKSAGGEGSFGLIQISLLWLIDIALYKIQEIETDMYYVILVLVLYNCIFCKRICLNFKTGKIVKNFKVNNIFGEI